MFKRLIEWIKSCFSGSIAVSDQNRGKVNVDIADKKARDSKRQRLQREAEWINLLNRKKV